MESRELLKKYFDDTNEFGFNVSMNFDEDNAEFKKNIEPSIKFIPQDENCYFVFNYGDGKGFAITDNSFIFNYDGDESKAKKYSLNDIKSVTYSNKVLKLELGNNKQSEEILLSGMFSSSIFVGKFNKFIKEFNDLINFICTGKIMREIIRVA